MTISSSIQRAIQNNNDAVDHLVKGDDSQAGRNFLTALQLVQEALGFALEKELSSHHNDGVIVGTTAVYIPLELDPTFLSSEFQQQHLNPRNAAVLEEEEKPKAVRFIDATESTTYRKYACGLHQYSMKISYSNDIANSTRACEAIAGIIIFNLGQVYLFQGLSCKPGCSSILLDQSRSLYERSYRLTTEHDVASIRDSSRVMGTLSNLALVNYLLNNQVNADKCVQTLLAVIVYLRQYYEEWSSRRPHVSSFAETHAQFLEVMAFHVLKDAITPPAA